MASLEGGKNPGEWEKEEDSGLSMLDVLEEEQQLEDDANAVLGGSDDKNCTYDMGYIGRQALYACSTCVNVAMEPAGVCLACSYDCHEGHDLYELYTKRNFRCDCGNSRFPNNCKLRPNKADTNPDNQYNQNFQGLYCTCKRPYPDPEDPVEDDMIQCIICEDWYHGRHLKTKVPSHENFDEMICSTCMSKHDFLWAYTTGMSETKIIKEDTTDPIEVGTPDKPKITEEKTEGLSETKTEEKPSETKGGGEDKESKPECKDLEPAKVSKKPDSEDVKPSSSVSKSDPTVGVSSDTCQLAELQKRSINPTGGATFWCEGWRKKLCRCDQCKGMYGREEVNFLLEEGDTVHNYEERGKSGEQAGSSHDRGMQALSSMDRMQQVEVLTEYNDLKTELKDYLKKFAENGKVVREEDIKEFFTKMEARKRQRVSSATNVQYFCK